MGFEDTSGDKTGTFDNFYTERSRNTNVTGFVQCGGRRVSNRGKKVAQVVVVIGEKRVNPSV